MNKGVSNRNRPCELCYLDWIRLYFSKRLNKIKTTKKSPNYIALGFALGTLLAILPTPGISIVFGIILLLIFPRISKISMMAAIAVWNPFVTAPIYALSYEIGDLFFRDHEVLRIELTSLNQAWNFSKRLLFGTSIIGLTASLLSFFMIKYSVLAYRNRLKDRQTPNQP
ncbi:MAG: DUF2062 domain-containing protein [Deltaproteobacteria bacterium]|nr:DUF2062 domain-containing protein [Deltaproteobacteria bacterium]